MSLERRQQIEAMLKDDPADAFLSYALAMEYVSEGDDAGAVQRFQRIVADSPGHVAAYFQCGQALVRLGRADEAMSVLQQGITAAQQAGELHTAEEMQGLLSSI